MSQRPAPLSFLMPGWFSIVLGLTGLALAWISAAPMLGDTALGLGLVFGLLGAGVFGVLLVASGWRLKRHPQAVADDLKHPVRFAFIAAIPTSMLLLATWLVSLGFQQTPVHVLWWAGSLLQWWAVLWVLGEWLKPMGSGPLSGSGAFWPKITPILFVPIVGNVLAPLAGGPLGYGAWAAAQFGVGVFFWPVLLTLVFVRRFTLGPLPERIWPAWLITLAPPSVIGVAMVQWGAPSQVTWALWGVGLFHLLWVGSTLGARISQLPFSIAFWGLSFPLTAFTTLTLKLVGPLATGWAHNLGMLMLAITSLVIFGLSMATVRGLRQGTLLAPEPIATLVPA